MTRGQETGAAAAPGRQDTMMTTPGSRGRPGMRPRPRLDLPAWRALLEVRWQQRLGTVTRLSLEYHEAAQATGPGPAAEGSEGRAAALLMQRAVAARLALSDTEAALARLSAGGYGRCEQCAGLIPVPRLRHDPETRYCGHCGGPPAARRPRPGPGRGRPLPGWHGGPARPAMQAAG